MNRFIILRLRLHGAIYRPNSFVLMLRYRENLKAIRYESTSLNQIVADKSHPVIVARLCLVCREEFIRGYQSNVIMVSSFLVVRKTKRATKGKKCPNGNQEEPQWATKSNEKQRKATKSNKKQQRTSELENPKRARKTKTNNERHKKSKWKPLFNSF